MSLWNLIVAFFRPMASYRISEKSSKMEQFHGGVYKDAFPGGEKQIWEETMMLYIVMMKYRIKEKIKFTNDKFSHDSVRSLLLYATTKFYFQLLPPAQYNREDFIEMLMANKDIERQDAVYVCKLIELKLKKKV